MPGISSTACWLPKGRREVLASVLDRRQERSERRCQHIAELNKRAVEADLCLKRLYDAIETGVADLGESGLKECIVGLTAIRDQAQADAMRTQAELDSAALQPVTTTVQRKFAATARKRMRIEGSGYRRDHLRAWPEGSRLPTARSESVGSKSNLLRTLAAKIGDQRRSQFCSGLAERKGFEPLIQLSPYGALAKRCLQPLGHLSVAGLMHRIDRQGQTGRRIPYPA